MAPSPENDNAPKAPDKSDTTKCEKQSTTDNIKDKDRDEKTLSNLNDGELKALLDEAINYKNPKDREGKSKLFKDLLTQAEESERIARATSAGGSEVARHYNSSARHQQRRHGGGRHQRHRQPASISENVVHGGSLDNLAKEELFREAAHCLVEAKSVSARQREGGSLPCDVNSSANVLPIRDYQFLEEAKKNRALKNKEYTAIDIESSVETQRLLDHDSLAQKYPENQEITILPRYTTNATLQISATPVDDPIPLELDSCADKKYDLDGLNSKVLRSRYSVFIPTYKSTDERRVDENGNALHQNQGKAKKKKIQTDKNVTVLTAERVEGHRSDIINDVDKLIQYIKGGSGGGPSSVGAASGGGGSKGGKSAAHKQPKQLHKQHVSEEGPSNRKKQRANSSKGKESRPELKKSNSLGEISTAALDDFAFTDADKDVADEAAMRLQVPEDRPKERRSWGVVQPPPFQPPPFQPPPFQLPPSQAASLENLESADNWVVPKPKKKGKRRRSSAGGRRPAAPVGGPRPVSPPPRAKSGPPSDKSDGGSSDNDSVRSLPPTTSYADIARAGGGGERRTVSGSSPEKGGSWAGGSSPEKGGSWSGGSPEKGGAVAAPGVGGSPKEGGAVGGPPDKGGAVAAPRVGGGPPKEGVAVVAPGVGGSPDKGGVVAATAVDSNIQNDLTIIHSNEKESIQFNAQMLPPNIPDVQSIEKMHFLNHPLPPSQPSTVEPAPEAEPPPPPATAGADRASPPPVVILSGLGSKEMTSGLVFGFDVNQQLLSEDLCDDFIARYVPPEVFEGAAINHDKIVNFIGSAWDAIVNESNGEVKYYSENS